MQKAAPQHAPSPHQPAARQQSAAPAHSTPDGEKIAQLEAMADSSPQAQKLAGLAAMMNAGPAMAAQRRLADVIHNSPRQIVQKKSFDAIHNSPRQAAQQAQSAVQMRHPVRDNDGQGVVQAAGVEAPPVAAETPGPALRELVGQLEEMRGRAIMQGAEAAGVSGLDEFRSRLEKLKEIAAGPDLQLQTQVLATLQRELTQAGVPSDALAKTAERGGPTVQRMPSNAPVQRLTGLAIAGIATAAVGVATLAYAIFNFCRRGAPAAAPAVGYGANPIVINPAGNIMQIAELERGSGPAVGFTAITSCLGVFHRNGANISAVHLPFLDTQGQAVSGVLAPVLLAAATGALGGGGTYYFVGERDVWLGSGANIQFNTLNGAFGGTHTAFGSGTYTASIDPVSNETVILRDGHEVSRGN